jgi:hypothetical protein
MVLQTLAVMSGIGLVGWAKEKGWVREWVLWSIVSEVQI